MIDVLVLGITVQALLTCLVLYVAARHEADYDFQKVLAVTAGLAVVTVVLDYALRPQIGWLYVFPCLAITAWVFHDFCWLTWSRACVCTLVLAVLNAGATWGIGFAAHRLFPPTATNPAALMAQHEADLREAKQALEDAVRDQQDVLAVAPVTASAAVTAAPPAAAVATPATTAAPPATAVAPPAATAATPTTHTAPAAATVRKPAGPAPVATAAPVAPPAEEWPAARARLRVSGRIRGPNGAPVALIGSQACAVGDQVSTLHNGRRYTWRVAAITDKSVDLTPVSCRAAAP